MVEFSAFTMVFSVVFATATVVVHVAFALAVWIDAKEVMLRTGARTFLVGAGLWGLGILVTGVLGAGIYWLIHHSTLRLGPVTAGKSEE
ncbi:hypothetical protein FEM03_11085 [Phragmitibacter flavus]|uniref:Uncharacterized protein n=1 Tax=Phragmitibacter flavus TaxID=2576071 RepID=A0A5R8KEW0_9BACT|nr:hypothetical protein [Phragmitibacter flavus]TLD70843.1 hypothetical protein FEM03_11085 [Phragmitibacter flavus]